MTDRWWAGKSEDEIQAHLERVRARVAAAAEAEQRAQFDQALAAADAYAWPPAPNTAHPSLERQAGFVRQLMGRGERRVLLAPPPKPLSALLAVDMDAPVEFDDARPPTVLEVRRAAGGAPWVGNPFVWEWRVAVDPGTNRWVAGDSEPRYRTWDPRYAPADRMEEDT